MLTFEDVCDGFFDGDITYLQASELLGKLGYEEDEIFEALNLGLHMDNPEDGYEDTNDYSGIF